jgi:ABC-type transporter Mla subunit MlaD
MIQVRERRTDRLNRARLQLEVKRAARPTIVVVLGLAVGLVCAIYVAVHVSRTLLSSTVEVRFAVSDASGVVAGLDEVRFKGIPAGTITGIQLTGGHPVLTTEIQTRYAPIYRNATAALRPNTALDDMYLDILDRGTPSAGRAAPSAPLPDTQTQTAVNIDDVLNVFKADQRVALRTLLDSLGNGLRDRGASLRTAFVELVPLLRVVGNISDQIAARAPLMGRLVHNTAAITTELGGRQRQLRVLLDAGSAVLTTLQSSSGGLAATLHELPPTLSELQSSFAAVRGVLPDVNTAVQALDPVAGRLPSTLAALRRLSRAANPALAALEPPVGQLVPLARELVPLAANLRATVDRLTPQTGTIDHATRDLVSCKQGVQGFFQWDASMSKFGDVRGPVPRGNVVFGGGSQGVVNVPNEYTPQACTPGFPIGGRVPTAVDKH